MSIIYTADEYKKQFDFPSSYKLTGTLCYGTFHEDRIIKVIADCVTELDVNAKLIKLDNPNMKYIRELKFGDKIFWFIGCYGGAWLSEYLHLACLFGSQKNILLGSCGGLAKGMSTGDYIIPTSSYSLESSAMTYDRTSPLHNSDEALSNSIKSKLPENYKVWRGPTITCQASMGQTSSDVDQWAKEGYYGVEMEASTVFAVSNYFNVPSAACVYVSDNLIENHKNISGDVINQSDMRTDRQLVQITAALKELLELIN